VRSQTRQILGRWLLTGTYAGTAAIGLFAQAAPAKPAAPAQRPATPAAPRPAAPAESAPANQRYVIIGCLGREGTTGTAAQRFTITEKRGEKPTMYRVEGDAKELGVHVGHQVELAGTLAPSPAGRGGALVLKASSLTWISPTCSK